MRITLRRSCAACAKAKHSCDLRTPKCSRCLKRGSSCSYANEPLNSSTSITTQPTRSLASLQSPNGVIWPPPALPILSTDIATSSFDPFDSYPVTSLPRLRVQSLMRHFLSKITFQYYPLDLDPGSNPFVTSWWPLALADPALFHVSLQTASLDDELQAQKGFPDSESLMADSVSLLRRKIQDSSLAFENATIDAVVTLAAIEHGKGNFLVSKMHIDGIKRMVNVRGGISQIKQTNPLTAKMVPWVSMLVMGSPQFETQDDAGVGDGISPIPQWLSCSTQDLEELRLVANGDIGLDPALEDILTRLRIIFHRSETSGVIDTSKRISTTELHDLTLFTLHRLLLFPATSLIDSSPVIRSECVRYATAIFMFIIHGPTYYSHAVLLNSLVLKLKYYLGLLLSSPAALHDPLNVWLLSCGMLAAQDTPEMKWFGEQARGVSTVLDLQSWDDVKCYLQSILWLESRCGAFRQAWEEILVTRFHSLIEDRTVTQNSESSPFSY